MAVVTDSNGYKGYIDKTGKLVIPCKFNSAYSFDGGEAVVNFEDKDGSNKICNIDKTGKIVKVVNVVR